MKQAIYFHAGCPVCVTAETQLLDLMDQGQLGLTRIHLGEQPNALVQAKALGVRSVPALVIEDQVFHINHGADLAELKGSQT